MIKIKIGEEGKGYPVYLHYGFLKKSGLLVKHHHSGCPILVVADKNVSSLYGDIFRQSLLREGFKPYMVVLEGGEKEKTLRSAFKLYGAALKVGLDRKSIVVALGGGVIGDLAGFVAATYMRGVSLVQVPTTLLAMVDSSVGGKVAVNHPLGKNIIGSFYQPSLVLSDVDILKTLPQREMAAGLAELVKYGIILDAGLFHQLERFLKNSFTGMKNKALLNLIAKAVLVKGKVVSLDEKEKDFRRILNFGHTIGHALESATDYNYYLHGEAVTIGMIAETCLSMRLGILRKSEARRILNLLWLLNPLLPPGEVTCEKVIEALFFDKKNEAGETVFVLPTSVGEGVFYKSPSLSEVRDVLEKCLFLKENKEVKG